MMRGDTISHLKTLKRAFIFRKIDGGYAATELLVPPQEPQWFHADGFRLYRHEDLATCRMVLIEETQYPWNVFK